MRWCEALGLTTRRSVPATGHFEEKLKAPDDRTTVPTVTGIFAKVLGLLGAAFLSVGKGAEIPYLADEYDPAKWPEAELVLSQQGTLKNVFDSGLRPYRFPALEKSMLEVKHLKLRIRLGSGTILPEIPTEWLDLHPYGNGDLATIEGSTPPLSLVRAREEILKWLPLGTNGRTEAELKKFLEAVKADPENFDDPYRGITHGFSVIWKEPGWKTPGGGPQCVAEFFKGQRGVPLRLHFKISWDSNRTVDSFTFSRTPISPPPGYEGVSMDAPRNIGPDSYVGFARAHGIDIGEGPASKPMTGTKKSAGGVQVSVLEKRDYWLIFGALFTILGLGLFWFAFRRRASDCRKD